MMTVLVMAIATNSKGKIQLRKGWWDRLPIHYLDYFNYYSLFLYEKN